MANCNDCICSEVCYYKSFNDVRNLEKRRNDVEKICKSFVHRDSLKNATTVDAVEVVRCKDCVTHDVCIVEDHLVFAGWENPFCCAGKRKDGDTHG